MQQKRHTRKSQHSTTSHIPCTAACTPHLLHPGKPLGFSLLHERSQHTHHGLHWCSHNMNTLTTCTTCWRCERNAISHQRNTSFHHAPTNFIRRYTPFLQIATYPCLDCGWTILITDQCTNTGSCMTTWNIWSL